MRDNKDDSKGISCNGDTSHLPFGGGIAGHSPKVLGQNYIWSECASLKMKDGKQLTDGIATAEGQNDRLNSKGNREEMLRPRVRLLKIHNLRATAVRKVTRQFQINTETRSSHDEANEPDDQR